jgi:Phage tail sheath protein subtilisin-like domain/Phage tail sheath C-terminal domain
LLAAGQDRRECVAMSEMIIPGTYISVRAEGLISAGRIASGIVGVVGTASSGPVGKAVTLSGPGDIRKIFGAPDDLNVPEDGQHPLTLSRALELVYQNGASSVMAVRVAGKGRAEASFAIPSEKGEPVAILTAKSPGTWANMNRVVLEPAADDCRIEDEVHDESFQKLTYGRVVESPQNRIRVYRGTTRSSEAPDIVYGQIVEDEAVASKANKYTLGSKPVATAAPINRIVVLDGDNGASKKEYVANDIVYDKDPAGTDQVGINTKSGEITFGQAPKKGTRVVATYGVEPAAPLGKGQVSLRRWDGALGFPEGDAPVQANGDRVIASYFVDHRDCSQVTLESGPTVEQFSVPDGNVLVRLVARSSALVTAEPEPKYSAARPTTALEAYFGTGSNVAGNNGADADRDEYAAGLACLANELVNIVVLAGQDQTMADVLLGHLNATEQTDHERMGVIGASGKTVDEFLGHQLASDRLVLVAPGLAYPDGTALPPAYAAAAVAGLMASVDVQTSLTNKAINVPGLTMKFNQGEQAQLIRRNVLALAPRNGYRVVKGLTTSGEGTPFSAIATRRIVDYAKYGVRSAAGPYLGRLNNSRVRAALKATLDGFLTRMVQDEALTGYELDVSATRSQEIAGEVGIVMTIQPTFSIEYIRVTMVLQ